MTSQNSISADKNSNLSFFLRTIRNSWTQAVAYFIILFLVGPVMMQIASNSYRKTIYRPENIDGYVRFISGTYCMYYIIVAIIAVICAILMFNYLNSRTGVNFYHSLPFKRTRLFFNNYLAGVIVFAIPALINYLLCIAVSAIAGMGIANFVPILTSIFVNSLIYFILFYSLTTMIGMLTGIAPVQWLLTVIAVSIIPAIKLEFHLLEAMSSGNYWLEYYMSFEQFYYTTPVAPIFLNQPFMTSTKILFIALALIFTAAAIIIYNYRLSERSGNSFVFNRFASVVKYLVMFPVSLGAAILFYAISDNSVFWLIFGGLIGSAITWMIGNSIINKNARAMFKGVKGFIIFAVAITIYLCVFAFGTDFIYDKLVTPENVSSITMQIDGDGELSCYEFKDKENISAILSLSEKYKANDFVSEYPGDYEYLSEYRKYESDDSITINGNEYYVGFDIYDKNIKFVAKGFLGKEFARSFLLFAESDDISSEMKTICESDEYRTQLLDKLSSIDENYTVLVDLRPNIIKDGQLIITQGTSRLPINTYEYLPYGNDKYDFGFIDAYKLDVENLSYKMLNSPAIGEIRLRTTNKYHDDLSVNLPITMNFTNTIEYFAKYGIINDKDYAQSVAEAVGDIYVYDRISKEVLTVSDSMQKAELISASGTGINGSGDDSYFVGYEDRYKVILEYNLTEYYYDTEEFEDTYEYGEAAADKTVETSGQSSILPILYGRTPEFVESYFESK